MAMVTIHEAKTHLSRLIARVEAGEEIVIARGKEPVARLERVGRKVVDRRPGLSRHLPPLPPTFFFDPLPDEELALWSGEGPDVIEP